MYKQHWNRRSFLSALPTVLACAGTKTNTDTGLEECEEHLSIQSLEDGSNLSVPEFANNPFSLGVASGGMLSDRVILWTRIAPDPFSESTVGGVEEESVPVRWEIALDDAFQNVVDSGVVATRSELAHAVHIDAGGLESSTWYWYRFFVGDWESPVGKTRTSPCRHEAVDSLKFATTSCHRYEDGYFTGLADLAEQNVDLVFQLGDYIYEYGPADGIRTIWDPLCVDLNGFRRRHALYKTDLDLQKAHASCPWEVLWDDHEVKNDYYGTTDDPILLDKMRAAYQAYYEHMPLRVVPPQSESMQMYRRLTWGDLAEFFLLDTRQYRTVQSCRDEDCVDIDEPSRTMLGQAQEQWLSDMMSMSAAKWNVLAQQIVMANFNISEALLNFDQWDGYPGARKRLIDTIIENEISNLLVFTGDIHIAGLAHLNSDMEDFDSPIVGYEFVTPSMTSNADELEENASIIEFGLQAQDNVSYINAKKRGYLLADMNHDKVTVSFRTVENVREENQPVFTSAVFSVMSADFSLLEDFNLGS